jgi:predicted O-methyltransferase YrrM
MMNVPPEDGRFLRLLVAASDAQRVLEIGTSNGVSALWMALALRETGGSLITIEIDSYRVALARENFKKARMNDIITLIEGDAFEEIPKLSGTFDFIFIDAWKEDYKAFYDLTIPLLERGGLLVAHNTVNAASDMPDFLRAIRTNPELVTEVVKVSWSGLSVSYRKR